MTSSRTYQTDLPGAFTTWAAFQDWTIQQGMGDLSVITYLLPLPSPEPRYKAQLLTPHYYQRKLVDRQVKTEQTARK
ncbi:hypothetical protein [Spirosoma oryzicola]|uniref:hypothetical protein n=1 Tax=Spirosoma oryzicola TaxID=2898794 RepID=UPI001E3F39E5|nr:hypothetical protein [Spirosoma oryzicola]UHG94779.1 hypothetical protein LQ777_28985 [Spirosoma oryzicola]